MLRNSLLTLHLLFIVVWLGGGLYDVFLANEAKKTRGTLLELPLLRMKMFYGRAVAVATILVGLTGVLMSSTVGWGYFTVLWLGVKQAIMIAVLVGFVAVTPVVVKMNREFERHAGATDLASERLRALSKQADVYYNLMRVGALIALALAVWKPT